MTEIKPCPFCGGEAHIAEIASGGIVTAYTACCNAIGDCIASDPMRYYATEAQAIEAWNTRAERTCYDTGECRWFCCSECGFGFNDMYANKEREYGVDASFPKYCPNCGARVVGGDAE